MKQNMDTRNSINRKSVMLILCCLFLISTTTNSQYIKYKFERLTTKNGLANSTINSILQDNTGFLWFGTYAGISKYDGYTFTNYFNDPENPNTVSPGAIVYIFQDVDRKIWIVNNGRVGLDRYDPVLDKFEHFKHDPEDNSSISSDLVYHIIQDSQNNLWVTTDNALNLMIKGKDKITFKRFYYPKTLSSTARSHINKDGVFLLLMQDIYYFDLQLNEFKEAGIELMPQVFNSLAEDKSGDVYLGTLASGIIKLKYNPASKTYSRDIGVYPNPTPNNRSCVVFEDNGQMWIGTDTKGLFNYNPSSAELTQFINNELDLQSLSDNSISSLSIDRTGILWVGTANQGLNSFDLHQNKFYHYRTLPGDINSLGGNLISAIHSLTGNEVWVGARGDGGVSRMVFDEKDNLSVIRYNHDPNNEKSIVSNNILCLVQRKNGDVWIGSGNTRLSRIVPQPPGLGNKEEITSHSVNGWTFTIFEDSEGVLWGGTWNSGLWRYQDETGEFKYYVNDPNEPSSLCDNVVWAIYEDSEKNMWIGGNKNGISVLLYEEKYKENPKFINFQFNKDIPGSLSNNSINAFLLDRSGTIWIASNGGLNYVVNSKTSLPKLPSTKKLEFKSFNTKNGLSSDGVVAVLEDLNNNLWLASSKGISLFNKKDSTFTNYYESDGLQSDEFLHNSYFISPNGRLFFGGKNGISAFYPDDIKANPFVPEIVLTDLKIFNKSVKVGEEVNNDIILEKALNEMPQIVLSHKNNVLTIEFAALHYVQPYKNQYAYYLEGFENDWNYVDNLRSATYTNLNPGKYVFRVKGSNNNGVWNEIGTSIIIRVKAPWWKTWVFRIFAILVILTLVYLGVRMRMEAMKSEKEFLQQKIEEGERELQIKKDEIEKQKQEIEEQNRKEFEIRYLNTGISRFSEIIASNRSKIDDLSRLIIHELVSYTDSQAGAVYLTDDEDPENIKIALAASYCFSSQNLSNKPFFIEGEGYIGTCYKMKKLLTINDLPDGYLKLSSGLGETSLHCCVLVPVIIDELCYGVLEVASFNELEHYKIDYINKLADNYASVIAIGKANQKTSRMLEQNRVQAEELMAQEEELRQNLEEMQATQEQLKRQMELSEKSNRVMHFEQSLTNTLLENARESIYFKDLESRFIKASNSMKDVFKVKHVEEIYGKTDFDFFTEEHARPAFEDEQNIIKTGIPIIDKLEKETHANGQLSYVTTTKMPLKDTDGNIIGTFGVSRNITDLVEMKLDIEQREKEMSEREVEIALLHEEIIKKNKLIEELEKKII